MYRDRGHAVGDDKHRTAAKADQRGQHRRAGGRQLHEEVVQQALALHAGQGQERGHGPGLLLRAGLHGPRQPHLQVDTHATALLRQRSEGEASAKPVNFTPFPFAARRNDDL